MLISDSQVPQYLGEAFRWRDLCLYRIVVIDYITAPIEVHRAWNVLLLILIAGSNVECVLYLRAVRLFALNIANIAPHVYNAEMWVVQMFRQPLGLYEKRLSLWL
jgi:hypothetical protein